MVYSFYQQLHGIDMGTKLAPALTNLYMAHNEQASLEWAMHKPCLWLRYIDDVFMSWMHRWDPIHKPHSGCHGFKM